MFGKQKISPQKWLLIMVGFVLAVNWLGLFVSFHYQLLYVFLSFTFSVTCLGSILGYILNKQSNKPKVNKQPKYFDMLDKAEQFRIIETYIQNNVDNLKSEFPEITGIAAGKKVIKGKRYNSIALIIQVEHKSEASKLLPTSLKYKSYTIPTDIQEASITKAQTLNIASGVSRNNDLMFGTLGIPMKKGNETYYMSCYHVYCNKELANRQLIVKNINDPVLVSPCFKELGGGIPAPVGNIVEGYLTDTLDIAFMKPLRDINPTYGDFAGPIYYRTLTRDQENKILLFFKGNGSKIKREGILRNISSGQFIDYEGKKQHYIRNLIQIDRCASSGDSGAAVCDLMGNYVGFVIASDNKYTYIISAYTIANETDYKFL